MNHSKHETDLMQLNYLGIHAQINVNIMEFIINHFIYQYIIMVTTHKTQSSFSSETMQVSRAISLQKFHKDISNKGNIIVFQQ